MTATTTPDHKTRAPRQQRMLDRALGVEALKHARGEQRAFVDLEDLLEDGADPNSIYESRSPIGHLVHGIQEREDDMVSRASSIRLSEEEMRNHDPDLKRKLEQSLQERRLNYMGDIKSAVRVLLRAGANPLQADSAFQRCWENRNTNGMGFFLLNLIGIHSPHLTDYQGGNPFHILAECDSPLFGEQSRKLREVLMFMSNGGSEAELPPAIKHPYTGVVRAPLLSLGSLHSEWLNQPRHQDGRTPLHLVLEQASAHFHIEEGVVLSEYAGQEDKMIIDNTWKMIHLHHLVSADPKVKDHSGKIVADLIDEIETASGLTGGSSQAKAWVGLGRLNSNTPQAASSNKKGFRL